MKELEDGDEDFFASKVGGKPIWPDLRMLPGNLNCKKCSKPLAFLLQFHAPLTSSDEDPRTLFVFMCKTQNCHSPGDARCFVVLRYEGSTEDATATPLTKEGLCIGASLSTHTSDVSEDSVRPVSDIYSTSNDLTVNSHDDSDMKSKRKIEDTPSLCIVCGGCGLKSCGGCRKVNYCSRDHQIQDWKLGHKKICSELAQSQGAIPPLNYTPSAAILLREWDVVTEPEPEICWKKRVERSEEERMAEYERYMREKGVPQEKLSEKELENAVGEVKKGSKDKIFKSFRKRIANEPEQVSACCELVCHFF